MKERNVDALLGYLNGNVDHFDSGNIRPYTEQEQRRFLELTRRGSLALSQIGCSEGERKPPEKPLMRMLSQIFQSGAVDDGFSDILLIVGRRDDLSSEFKDDEMTAPLSGRELPEIPTEYLLRRIKEYGHSNPNRPDKAVYVDFDGEVYGIKRRLITPPTFILNGTGEQITEMGDSVKPKHVYAAYLSTRGPSVAYLHGETGKVLTFLRGRVVPELSF